MTCASDPASDRPVIGVELDRLRSLMRKLGRRVEETTMTAAERLRAEGRAEGEAKFLLKQLTALFGELPPAARARIEAASTDELDVFGKRVRSAASLAEVLA